MIPLSDHWKKAIDSRNFRGTFREAQEAKGALGEKVLQADFTSEDVVSVYMDGTSRTLYNETYRWILMNLRDTRWVFLNQHIVDRSITSWVFESFLEFILDCDGTEWRDRGLTVKILLEFPRD